MSRLLESLAKLFSNWAATKVRCIDCGHVWTAIYPNFKGGVYKLECPKCKKRNSEPVNK